MKIELFNAPIEKPLAKYDANARERAALEKDLPEWQRQLAVLLDRGGLDDDTRTACDTLEWKIKVSPGTLRQHDARAATLQGEVVAHLKRFRYAYHAAHAKVFEALAERVREMILPLYSPKTSVDKQNALDAAMRVLEKSDVGEALRRLRLPDHNMDVDLARAYLEYPTHLIAFVKKHKDLLPKNFHLPPDDEKEFEALLPEHLRAGYEPMSEDEVILMDGRRWPKEDAVYVHGVRNGWVTKEDYAKPVEVFPNWKKAPPPTGELPADYYRQFDGAFGPGEAGYRQ